MTADALKCPLCKNLWPACMTAVHGRGPGQLGRCFCGLEVTHFSPHIMSELVRSVLVTSPLGQPRLAQQVPFFEQVLFHSTCVVKLRF